MLRKITVADLRKGRLTPGVHLPSAVAYGVVLDLLAFVERGYASGLG